MASGSQIQFNTADQPVIQFNPADQVVGETKPTDPLGTFTPEEYSRLDPGRQQIRQKLADFKANHPTAFEALQGLYESLPGGMEMSMPGGIGRMAGAAGTAASVASNPKFMKGAGLAVGGLLGHSTGIPGGGWIGAYAGKEVGESLADWLATRSASVAEVAEEAPPTGVDPEAWGKLPQNIKDAIKRGAQARAAGQGYTPAPEPASAPGPAAPAPANTVPEAQGIDTSALRFKTPTAAQARAAFMKFRTANGLPVEPAPEGVGIHGGVENTSVQGNVDEMLAAAKAKLLAQNPELAKYLVLEEEPKPAEPDLEDLLTKALAKAKAAKGGAVTAP